MNPIVSALALLTPYEINIPKRRLGPDGDGGYVFADRFNETSWPFLRRPKQTFICYGISNFYDLEAERAAAGHKVYMFDHTIDGITRSHPNMIWHREGVAGETKPNDLLYTVADHLKKYEITDEKMILKMDVEGAEFDAIGMMSDETLGRFEQIVLEIHGIMNLVDEQFRNKFVKMLTKLNSQFTLFHVHANNFDVGPPYGHPTDGIVTCAGVPVSNLLECSFIRTSTVRRSPNRTLYPTPLDAACMKTQRDKLLWFFPFVPTPITNDEFIRCEERAGAHL